MRWKGTVNNYQGIICYWVGEQLPPSPSLWVWAPGSGLHIQTSSLRGVRGSFHFSRNKLHMSLSFPSGQTGGNLKRTNKKLSKGFKFHPKKSCCCWAPRVDLYQSKSIVCHEHSSSEGRDHCRYNVTVTHSGSIITSLTDQAIFLIKIFSCQNWNIHHSTPLSTHV